MWLNGSLIAARVEERERGSLGGEKTVQAFSEVRENLWQKKPQAELDTVCSHGQIGSCIRSQSQLQQLVVEEEEGSGGGGGCATGITRFAAAL